MNSTDLKYLLEWLGMTPSELADAVGVKKNTVHYWTQGRNPIPAWAAHSLAYIIRHRAILNRDAAEAIISIPIKQMRESEK
jgi:DNA-binding transcriptional regulator YiaG